MLKNFDRDRITRFVQEANEPCVAVFDVGTRAVRVLVAPKKPPPAPWIKTSFCNDSILANLGLDVSYEEKILSPHSQSMRATVDFLNSRRRLLQSLGVNEFSAVATAWIRWLNNPGEIIAHVEERTGLRIEVIDQEWEAELTILSLPEILRRTRTGREIQSNDMVFMFDQGGGSLEVSWMRWDQAEKDRPRIGKQKFEDLGTVALRRQFFYHDADGKRCEPSENRAKVFAQIGRIQDFAKGQLTKSWSERGALLRSQGTRHAFAVGSAITNLFPNRIAANIHYSRASIERITSGLTEVHDYYDKLNNPVMTIYKKLQNLPGKGVTSITRTNAEMDAELNKLYGLPIYLELMAALNIEQVRILGYPLRFGFYLWKYQREQSRSTVRSDTSGPYVFVSYCRQDASLVYDLLATLDALGIRVWWDEEGLGLACGEEFEPQIAAAIKSSSATLWCLTPDAEKSRFVRREVTYASNNKVKVLPLEMRRTTLSDSMDFLFGSHNRLPLYGTPTKRFREELAKQIPRECFRHSR